MQALDVAQASRPAGPTSGQPSVELTAWLGPLPVASSVGWASVEPREQCRIE